MKNSDSSNSLNELIPSGPSCFICLEEEPLDGEELVGSETLRKCGCRFHVHPVCWKKWMKNKTDFDCPICHRDVLLRIEVHPIPLYRQPIQLRNPRACTIYFFIVVGVSLACIIYYSITRSF
jgi:hypothetical protein